LVFGRHLHPWWAISLAVATVTLLGVMIYLGINRNLKWWSYEILEMAALPVDEVKEGYTNRPMPIGQIATSRDELIRFSRYIKRHLIAIPRVESDKVIFLIAHSRFKLFSMDTDYSDETFISFSYHGGVTVNISLEDYEKYKDSYAFDQLCDHLGKLFIEFYEHYKKGDQKLILSKLKEMNQ
ncbi:hypothetical protein ACFLS7_07100, partial [Bacteroidota bacterium]